MNFAAGTLIKAREREWVVLPESQPDFLVVKPLGGTADEIAGISTALEKVEPATFAPPGPPDLGDFFSCRLLRDASQLGFRSSAGPFRSFGRLAVQPRPYQLVPLLMALKLDPVRLLIADDVGIGKTIEAALIARELLDRAEITRLCVLCPPPLAEQWQAELSSKFNLDAKLVLSSTVRSLERNLPQNQSLFEVYPHVIVSTDFIKSDSRYRDFLRACPDFVIVDEAHTCADPQQRGAAHQRWRLLSKLAESQTRHLVLVTATPHSGNEDAFRALLTILNPEFQYLPADLSGPDHAHHRRRVAAHLVQRRREDIKHYLGADTPFPGREDKEDNYTLSPPYKALFARVLDYARESVADTTGGALHQRVRWWSALSLLRAMASSPAAAAATLRERSTTAEATDTNSADQLGRQAVLDQAAEAGDQVTDITAGADPEAAEGDNPNRRRLRDFAREADALCGHHDAKLIKLVRLVRELLDDGFRPVIFCRFIPTADYVADELRKRLGNAVEVASLTSQLPPAERMARIEALPADHDSLRLLVCTDCLSEGINLQEKFDAVVHYDLSWNPTRHEQRDGRVDRYNQKSKKVRILTYYGLDNQIDGIVLEILLQKHRTIRNALGISVPVPVDTDKVVEAIFEGLLLRGRNVEEDQNQMVLFEDYFKPLKKQLHEQWEAAKDRESRSRSMFKQESIDFREVARELDAANSAIGSPAELEYFFTSTLQAANAIVSKNGAIEVDLAGTQPAVREAVGQAKRLRVSFQPTYDRKALALHRTHPIVEGLASWLLNTALDPTLEGFARRAGVIRTQAVTTRTVLLLLRLRYHIITTLPNEERSLLAEDSLLASFTGQPQNPAWSTNGDAETLLRAASRANVPPDVQRTNLTLVTEHIDNLRPALAKLAKQRAEELLAAHRRVRTAAGAKGAYRIEDNPPDILGLYIFLPVATL